jgi:hypothetical protein
MTPAEQLRQAAWAAFSAWLFRVRRWPELEDPGQRLTLVAAFDEWCETADEGKRAHLAGQIDPGPWRVE